MRPSILLLPLLLACEDGTIGDDTGTTDTDDTGSDTDSGDSDDTSTDTDTDTGSNGGCQAAINWQSPQDDETNVSVNKEPTVRFSAVVAATEWSMTVDGVTGTAALAQNGLSATFTPAAELATDTDYTMRTTVCGVTAVTTFRTASGPLAASAIEGRTYAVPYDDVTWMQPAGISTILAFLGEPFEYLLLNVVDVDEAYETITAAGGPGVTDDPSGDIVQDPCAAPTVFEPTDFSGNPVMEVGPADLVFDAGGTPVTVQGAYYKAVFVENGDAIVGIDVSGQVDGAAIGGALGFDPCTAGAIFGISCVQCVSNPSSQSCLDVRIVADRGEWVDGLVYDPDLDPSIDPTCN